MRAAVVASVLSIVASAAAQTFSDDTVARVKTNLASAAKQSWELGTRAQTLLELDAPQFSVFSEGSIPPPFNSQSASSISDVLEIASNAVNALPDDSTPRPLDSGAGGDPPSMGIAVLLAHASGSANAPRYLQAAENQLEFVLNSLPRSKDGAISHRVEQVQLWADFIYMTPPFLAYFGAYQGNKTLVDLAYQQCKVYEHNLYDNKKKLWRHMALGASNDQSLWATGQGWAAMGMLRVLATMKHSQWSDQFKNQMNDLEHWVSNILDGMYSYLDQKTLLDHNHVDDSSTFLDAAGTTLVTAATYRLALLRDVYHHLPDAERVRQNLVGHVDSDGWLTPVVNPESFSNEGSRSPEGQAFVLQLHAAYNEWDAAGRHGENTASTLKTPGRLLPTLGLVLVMALVIL